MPLSVAKAFGSALRNIRRHADMTQERLAENSGLSRVTMWKIENAESVANLDTVYRISRGLGISMTDLIAATEDQLGETDTGKRHGIGIKKQRTKP